MSRERMLFAGVVAILVLWLFAFRDPVVVAGTVEPATQKLEIRPVQPLEKVPRTLTGPDAFTVVTNESPHPRPRLPLAEPRDLPGIWPPTSYSLSLSRLAGLRRPIPAPDSAAASIEPNGVALLPSPPTAPGTTWSTRVGSVRSSKDAGASHGRIA